MARWYKRPGRAGYYLDWWENGIRERHPCDATTDTEADEAVAALELRLAKGRVVIRGAPTLKKLIEDFLADKKEKREGATFETYDKHARHFAERLPLSIRASELTPEHIETYLQARTKVDGVAKITANKERVTLATIYNWAVKRRIVEANPVRAVDSYSVRPSRPEPCPENIYRSLIRELRADVKANPRADQRASRGRMADMAEVMWETALRAGEVCRLRPEDVDPKTWTMYVRAAGNKGPRTVVIPKKLQPIFRRWLKLKRAFVFALEDGSYGYRALYKCWGIWLRDHPAHRPAHFHALRHAFSARCEANDVDPRITQELLGHATLKMTGHYSHRGLDVLRAAHERLANAARGRGRGRR